MSHQPWNSFFICPRSSVAEFSIIFISLLCFSAEYKNTIISICSKFTKWYYNTLVSWCDWDCLLGTSKYKQVKSTNLCWSVFCKSCPTDFQSDPAFPANNKNLKQRRVWKPLIRMSLILFTDLQKYS